MDTVKPHLPTIKFTIKWEAGRMVDVTTNSPAVNHFLGYIKLTRAYHTWVNYTHDLKSFFTVVGKQPSAVTRSDCLDFMRLQVQADYTNATINRRLAAISSLFNELHLFDSEQYPLNPVFPQQRPANRPKQSLYRKQPQHLPQLVTPEEVQTIFEILPSCHRADLVS